MGSAGPLFPRKARALRPAVIIWTALHIPPSASLHARPRAMFVLSTFILLLALWSWLRPLQGALKRLYFNGYVKYISHRASKGPLYRRAADLIFGIDTDVQAVNDGTAPYWVERAVLTPVGEGFAEGHRLRFSHGVSVPTLTLDPQARGWDITRHVRRLGTRGFLFDLSACSSCPRGVLTIWYYGHKQGLFGDHYAVSVLLDGRTRPSVRFPPVYPASGCKKACITDAVCVTGSEVLCCDGAFTKIAGPNGDFYADTDFWLGSNLVNTQLLELGSLGGEGSFVTAETVMGTTVDIRVEGDLCYSASESEAEDDYDAPGE